MSKIPYTSKQNEVVILLETDEYEKREVLMLHECVLKPFPHPKSIFNNKVESSNISILFMEINGNIYEFQSVEPRKFGCWFINQRISSSNTFHIASKVDIRFLVLPFFENSSGKYSPLDQIVTQHEGFTKLPLEHAKTWSLDDICDINDKFGDDMILYKYNEEKVINWLNKKVNKTARTLVKQKIGKASNNSTTFVKQFNASAQSSKTHQDSVEVIRGHIIY